MAAAVPATPVLLDRDATIAKVVALCEKAAAEGARLVAFPKAFVPSYPDWGGAPGPGTPPQAPCTPGSLTRR